MALSREGRGAQPKSPSPTDVRSPKRIVYGMVLNCPQVGWGRYRMPSTFKAVVLMVRIRVCAVSLGREKNE
jgi:hypothetical protein